MWSTKEIKNKTFTEIKHLLSLKTKNRLGNHKASSNYRGQKQPASKDVKIQPPKRANCSSENWSDNQMSQRFFSSEMYVCLQPLGIAASGANIRTCVTNFVTLHTVTRTFILSHGHQNAFFFKRTNRFRNIKRTKTHSRN